MTGRGKSKETLEKNYFSAISSSMILT